MNSLRKTFLALSLLAFAPSTVQAINWPSWADVKSFVGKLPEAAKPVSKFAKDNKKATAAGVLGTAGVIGAGYFAKKYAAAHPETKFGKVVNFPTAAVKSVYGKFTALSRKKQAGVVVGGAIALAGTAWLAKALYVKYNAGFSPASE